MSPSTSKPQDAFKRPSAQPYRSVRSSRFYYAAEAMDAIINWNCHGCSEPTAKDVAEYGDGGACDLLVQVVIGDGEPIPELLDNGRTIRCQRRHVDPPSPPQAESLFEASS